MRLEVAPAPPQYGRLPELHLWIAVALPGRLLLRGLVPSHQQHRMLWTQWPIGAHGQDEGRLGEGALQIHSTHDRRLLLADIVQDPGRGEGFHRHGGIHVLEARAEASEGPDLLIEEQTGGQGEVIAPGPEAGEIGVGNGVGLGQGQTIRRRVADREVALAA